MPMSSEDSARGRRVMQELTTPLAVLLMKIDEGHMGLADFTPSAQDAILILRQHGLVGGVSSLLCLTDEGFNVMVEHPIYYEIMKQQSEFN